MQANESSSDARLKKAYAGRSERMSPPSDRFRRSVLLRASVAVFILLIGMIMLIMAVALLSPVFSALGGGLAGVGLGGLYCGHRYGRSKDDRHR
jgi:hypothetical protein